MPIVRLDLPEGHSRETKSKLKKRIRECIVETWAKEHIYIAIREMFTEPGEEQAIMTVDLRPGRGQEQARTNALYRGVVKALQDLPDPKPETFVMLVRQVPAEGFATEAGPLPDLGEVTPAIRTA